MQTSPPTPSGRPPPGPTAAVAATPAGGGSVLPSATATVSPEVAAPTEATEAGCPDGADGVTGSRHDALDDALVAIRRVLLRPGYRARLLEGLPGRVELAILRLLRTVQRHDGPPSIGEVAEVLTVDPSTASRVVDRAVDAGLLERRACTDDRRRARLHLTVVGDQLLDRATARRRELLAEVTSEWEAHELDQLVEQLHALIAGFDRLEGSA